MITEDRVIQKLVVLYQEPPYILLRLVIRTFAVHFVSIFDLKAVAFPHIEFYLFFSMAQLIALLDTYLIWELEYQS